MGKAARKQRRQNSDTRARQEAEREVRSYMRALGVPRPSTAAQFWTGLSASLGETFADDLLDRIELRESGKSTSDVYDLIFESEESVIQTAPLVNGMAEEWLRHFTSMALPSGDVLDLGSGSGIYTCFYAAQRPENAIVGVEKSARGVERGNELALRLGLDNVEFVQADLSGLELGRKFSVVCSTLVYTEVDEPSAPRELAFGSIRSADTYFRKATSSLAEAVHRHLLDDGVYTSVERLPGFDSCARWIGAQQNAQLGVALYECHALTWEGVLDGQQRTIAVTARPGIASTTFDDLLSWYTSEVEPVGSGNGIGIEMYLAQSDDVTFTEGMQFEVDDGRGPAATRLYLIGAGGRALIYMTTSRGFRQIVAEDPRHPSAALTADFKTMVMQFTSAAEVTGERKLNERELLDDLGL